MRLKRVRIFGFKTFADRTEFDVEGGVIAVIGPNGCGKSNLVDAILWGLGEGNARQLRAQSSQDVIFSGSSNRKPVGFTEVSLLFDNEDGALPIDSAEVTVSRKLTRSGDSEYSINRQTCRLRDIFELLADSGLGRSGYSIVGQKEIDQALAASAEDRRAWVDEAAGVQRYRARKIEALRRLNAAGTHLERVTDILTEIESQREPLREEAEAALRFKSVQSSLREIESGLLVVEVAKAAREVEEQEKRAAESTKLAEQEGAQAAKCEELATQLQKRVTVTEGNVERLRNQLQETLTTLERADSAIKLGQQRHQTLEELEAHLGEEAEVVQHRIKEAESERDQLSKEAQTESAALDTIRTESAGAGEQASKLSAELKALETELTKAREIHAARLKHEAEVAHNRERQKAVQREIKGIDSTLPDLEAGITEAQTNYDEAANEVQALQTTIKRLTEEMARISADEARDAQAVRQLLAERAALEGRRQGIEATIDAHEGLNQGARAVLEMADRKELHAEYIPVGEAVEVEKEYALAIETALGASANDLIVYEDRHAKEAIELLKAGRLGRATFQPIPLMRPVEVNNDLRKVLGERGVITRASELVDCKSAFRPVIDSLLGRVVIVESLDDALRLAKTNGWSRMVTLDGEVVHSGGAVTGGQAAKHSYGLVQRKSDLIEVQHKLDALEKEIKTAEKRAAERAKLRATHEDELKTRREELAEREEPTTEARRWLQSLQEEHAATLRSKQKLVTELESLSNLFTAELQDVDVPALEAKRDTLLKALAARSADAEQAESRLREAEMRLSQAQLRFHLGQKRYEAALESEKLRERKLENLGPEKEKAQAEIAAAQKQKDQDLKVRKEVEEELALRQAERTELLGKIQETIELARTARNNVQACLDAAHQAELIRARADAKRAASLQRLIEEYNLTEDDALAQESKVELPPDAAVVVGRLRRELKAMGDVNLGAVEAYERLTTRSDELTAQLKDIHQGIEQVTGSIRELDKLTRERFLTTFAQVEVAFSELFTKLFGGGEGKISLNMPDNVLESGIEIDVTLPGKKKQRLELLSGGERSLCATAFLFSLLRVKPSPLVILDEVDAPLDGGNVERFVALLHEFSADMQFIVITHNPTTIESAPIWLGVTMQEPGVSTLVPARLPAPALLDRAAIEVREPVKA